MQAHGEAPSPGPGPPNEGAPDGASAPGGRPGGSAARNEPGAADPGRPTEARATEARATEDGVANDGVAVEGASVELARAAQGGAADALARLVERHGAAVQAIVRRRLGSELRRFHESGDIVQEALVQAVKSFDRYDLADEQAFLRWIAGVVENRLRDLAKLHRAQRRGGGAERRLGSLDLPDGADGTPGAGPGPATQVAAGDRDARVRAALERLDARTRGLIEARLDERPWADVAREFGFPSDGAARMAWSRALVALSRELRGLDGEAS